MRIAIAGAGMTGAYLYRLLCRLGYTVDIFDKDPETRCGISPCAWGTSRGFAGLVDAAGLDPADYTLERPRDLLIGELRIKADLVTIDKPRLINDLLGGVAAVRLKPDFSQYDRVIDATGVARAFLPAIEDDLVVKCVQYRVMGDTLLENRIKLGRIGYGWCFPLSANQYHIGCGSLLADPLHVLRDLGWLNEDGNGIRCACRSAVRLAGPQFSRPFVATYEGHEVWGVGESIGCVAPLAGDGIVPGMKSAQLLIEQWNDPERYTGAVLKEFSWMEKERQVVDKLRKGAGLTLKDAWVLNKNSKRMGMEIGLKDAGVMLRQLR